MDQLRTDTPEALPETARQRVWSWIRGHKLRFLFICFVVVVFGELISIPWFGVSDLRTENPTETALMRQRMHEAEVEGKTLAIKRQWVSLSRIPRNVINAVVVAEDGTFWEHGGFDWYEFQASLKKNWEKKRAVRGASTITQQLAKNLYLSTSKDPIRKLKEWAITALLEHYLTKQRILELYLNLIEWGRGIFGIEAAARAYFGRSASALTYEQALRLAAVIPSPLKHRPTDNSRWVIFRRQIVAARMSGRKFDVTDEPEEDDEENQKQRKETESSQPTIELQPNGAGSAPVYDSTGRDTMPHDSIDIGKGDSDDVQRRKQAD